MPQPIGGFPLQLLSAPRRRILGLLRRGDHTIPELATELSVSANAVRGHLAALGRDGLVASGEVRRDAPGKPPTLYGLTAAAEDLFPRGAGALLLNVLDLLCDWDGADAAAEVLRAAGARARGVHEGGAVGVTRVLESLGADVATEEIGTQTMVTTSGCPLAAQVLARPELCAWMAALASGAAGGEASAACDRTGGRPRCRFKLPQVADSAS